MSQASTILHIVLAVREGSLSTSVEFHRNFRGFLEDFCFLENSQLVELSVLSDHIHLLMRIRKESSVSSVLHNLKSKSENWLRSELDSKFLWSSGYSAFQVEQKNISEIATFVVNQSQFHQSVSYKDELKIIMLDGIDSFLVSRD